jgi:hypothetical protein
VQGYSYEAIVTAMADGTVCPLLASVDMASASEDETFGEKIDQARGDVKKVLLDSDYGNNDFGECIEWSEKGKHTDRRFLCYEYPSITIKMKMPAASRHKAILLEAATLAETIMVKSNGY